MEEQIKFTQEELTAIAELQRKYGAVTFRFGQLHLEKEGIEARMDENAIEFENTKKELNELRNQERILAESFQKKYGNGQLNLETGIFTPNASPPVTA